MEAVGFVFPGQHVCFHCSWLVPARLYLRTERGSDFKALSRRLRYLACLSLALLLFLLSVCLSPSALRSHLNWGWEPCPPGSSAALPCGGLGGVAGSLEVGVPGRAGAQSPGAHAVAAPGVR